jgi:hypothetical protein
VGQTGCSRTAAITIVGRKFSHFHPPVSASIRQPSASHLLPSASERCYDVHRERESQPFNRNSVKKEKKKTNITTVATREILAYMYAKFHEKRSPKNSKNQGKSSQAEIIKPSIRITPDKD